MNIRVVKYRNENVKNALRFIYDDRLRIEDEVVVPNWAPHKAATLSFSRGIEIYDYIQYKKSNQAALSHSRETC